MIQDQVQTMALDDLLAQGGWAMYPIYLCSVLTIGAFIKKLSDLRAARLHDIGWFKTVLDRVRDGDLHDAARTVRGVAHPGAKVVTAVVAALEQAPHQAEAEAQRTAAVEQEKLARGTGLLSFLAQVSPLLGLFGTVMGMVDLFLGLQGAGDGNLAISELASGIWKALLTTAAGLAVAVPALAGHTFLTSRFDKARLQLLDLAQRLLFAAEATAHNGEPED